MFGMDDKLLALPWQIQLSLGAGYLAYLIAYAGNRQHHTATDTVFRSAAFGIIASTTLLWLPSPLNWPSWFPHSKLWRPALALTLTVIAGALWRWRGMRWSRELLRFTNVSWSDDIPSAWLSITTERTDVHPSQIAVDLNDGRTLVCDDTRQFEDAPYGPCKYGLDGSIAFYVTAERRPDGTWIDAMDVRQPGNGDRITFIPASAIKRIELRLWTRANAKGEKAEAEATDLEEPLAVEATSAAPNQEYTSAGGTSAPITGSDEEQVR